MPALGVAQETGRVIKWLKAEGDEVVSGDPLVEIETDKTMFEMEAPASGVLGWVDDVVGRDVPVGMVIGLIVAPGEQVPRDGASGPSAHDRATEPDGRRPGGDGGFDPSAPATLPPSALEREPRRRTPASPVARRRARQAGIDLETLQGSGPGGAVTAGDLEAAVSARSTEAEPAATPVSDERHEPGPIWRRMAERTTETWAGVPHFYLFREVRADRLLAWQESEGQGVTLTDLLVKVAAAALRRHPEANAAWGPHAIVRFGHVNVGLAVAVDEGLVVPVITDADRLSVRQIARRRQEAVDRTRRGALEPDDVAGGTFTITNLGMYGVDAFAAVLNGGQAAILSVGRVSERVVAEGGRPRVAPCMGLGLSCDHRALDGVRAARFLDGVAGLIEEPLGLLE